MIAENPTFRVENIFASYQGGCRDGISGEERGSVVDGFEKLSLGQGGVCLPAGLHRNDRGIGQARRPCRGPCDRLLQRLADRLHLRSIPLPEDRDIWLEALLRFLLLESDAEPPS